MSLFILTNRSAIIHPMENSPHLFIIIKKIYFNPYENGIKPHVGNKLKSLLSETNEVALFHILIGTANASDRSIRMTLINAKWTSKNS